MLTTSVDMRRYSYKQLVDYVREILVAALTPSFIAQKVAEVIVNADLTGHSSHGINALSSYIRGIQAGTIKPFVEPFIVKKNKSKVFLDGADGFGHFAALKSTDIAVDVAKKYGTASVWLKNSNNIGRLGEYIERIVAKNCIGLIMSGTALVDSDSVASVPGYVQRVLGTNPIAIGIPTSITDRPFIIDLSTTVTSYYNIELYSKLGKEIPSGWVVDSNGSNSNSPDSFYDGGALALLGGYKGLALSLMVCMLCGFSDTLTNGNKMYGTFLFVIDLEDEENAEDYKKGIREFLYNFSKRNYACRLPYDRSYFMKKRGLEEGISLPLVLVKEIDQIARELNINNRLIK